MSITLRDGRTVEAIEEYNRGSVENPMSDNDLRAKFDEFLPFEDKGGATLVSALLRDARWQAGPAFTFLNLMEPHLPYRPPGRFLDATRGSDWSRWRIRFCSVVGRLRLPFASSSSASSPAAPPCSW